MREQELRKVVEEVVRSLARKGLLDDRAPGFAQDGSARKSLNDPAGGPAKRVGEEVVEGRQAGNQGGAGGPPKPMATTIGTAGKVFSSEWSLGFKGKGGSPLAGGGGAEDAEEDGCSGCRGCGGKSAPAECPLQSSGADRLGVCQPTKPCSKVARMVDHTILKANATQEEVAVLCGEARTYCFASVCVNPSYVPLASQLLRGSGVKVCTVIGFPLGSTTSTVKALEARDAIANGADEIDMVINVGALKSGNDSAVFEDIRSVREATRGRVLKVILETSLLSREEKVRACLLSKKASADFVKTSTGFSTGGATVEDVRLMRETVGPGMGVKASGGIRDAKAAQAMIEAGATRLGTSASVAIVTAQAEGVSGPAKGY